MLLHLKQIDSSKHLDRKEIPDSKHALRVPRSLDPESSLCTDSRTDSRPRNRDQRRHVGTALPVRRFAAAMAARWARGECLFHS